MRIEKIDNINNRQKFGVQVGSMTVKTFDDMIQRGLVTRKFGETAVQGQRDVFQKAVRKLSELGHPDTKIDINPEMPWEFTVSNPTWGEKVAIYNSGSFSSSGEGPATISQRLLAVAQPKTVEEMEALLR